MAYEVLARKWRPQQFDDVVGQQHVTQTLKNAIESSRIAHAYLFVGPRGIGKTSVARIFAKALNCATGPTVRPCDKCDSCREITAGTSLDVLEIDGASNNGVEQVRDLRDNVKYAPARGPYKIYIIDEVHMLSQQAFNALLKTLEEPPEHVKFVFATTEPQRILATILSRCQRFDLRRIPAGLIVERLGQIAESEGIAVSQDALLAVARGAEGGLRDATSALDQLIAFRGKQIEEQDVLSVFGLVARSTLEALADAVLEGEITKLLEIVAELDENGKDMQRLVLELIEHFRNLLICIHAPAGDARFEFVAGGGEKLNEQAQRTDTARILRITDVLIETEDRLRHALSKRTLLETALIRCARASCVVSIDRIVAQVTELGKRLDAAGAQARGLADVPAPARRSAERGQPAKEMSAGRPAPIPAAGSDPAPACAPGEESEFVAAHWAQVLDWVGEAAPLARSSLAEARPLSADEREVLIGFDREHRQQAKRAGIPRNKVALRRALSRLFGRDTNVRFQVGEAKQKGGEQAGEKPKRPRRSRAEWVREPAVQKVLEVFDGTVVDVRE